MSLPLVSCVMPTYGRPDYVAESIAMFLAQDYPAKELIVLNDCPGQILRGRFPGVRIINSDSRWHSLGEKRNAAIEMAAGDYIAVWDDDDVYFPWRISHSIQQIQATSIPYYCPAEFWAYWGEEKLRDNYSIEGWCCHPGMMYSKALWAAVDGYPSQTLGEDQVFLEKAIQHLGGEWPRDRIAKSNRFLVMRCVSKYIHTSIQGGREGPDAEARNVDLRPSPVDDLVLRAASETQARERELWHRRKTTIQKRTTHWPGFHQGIARYWVDQLVPVFVEVGYGQLGLGGDLGYEGKRVEVCGELFPHAISAHAGSRLKFQLNGKYTHFCSQVALNDDIPFDASSADFMVYADGQLKGVAKNIHAGQIPRLLIADIRGASELELVVDHHRWDFCHSVWCDPFLVSNLEESFVDGLRRAEIDVPQGIPEADLCIATVGSPGYEEWIDDLFGSIRANGQCPSATLAVFSFGESEELRRIAQTYDAIVIPCRSLVPLSCASKSVLYSAWRSIPAKTFICLDADMIVMDDLLPVVGAIKASPPGSILVCREAQWAKDIANAIGVLYAGQPEEINRLLAKDVVPEAGYSLIVNDGFFAGTAAALAAMDSSIRGFSGADRWVDEAQSYCPWRNQFIFNLAIAQSDCGRELDPRYNVQLNLKRVAFQATDTVIHATTSSGTKAAVVHFNGRGRVLHSEWRGRYRDHQLPSTPIEDKG